MKTKMIFTSLLVGIVVLGWGILAQASVLCVNTTGASCSSTYSTIQGAVSASSPGDTILVGPGTYNEQVTINTPNLYIEGAQAGNDATKGRQDARRESIVDSSSGAFVVNANKVVIDGFTVEGAQGGKWAITMNGTHGSRVEILNNIIQNNSLTPPGTTGGLSIQPGSRLSTIVIQGNLFRNEVDGIFAGNVSNVLVSGNEFVEHQPNAPNGNAAAINFHNNSRNVMVTNNTAYDNQTFIVVGPDTTNLDFSHNLGKHFSGSAVYVTGANNQLTISDNVLEDGDYRAIKFNQDFGPGPSTHVRVSYNIIKHMDGYGILITGGSSPTLTQSIIIGNIIQDNGIDGINANPYALSDTIITNNELLNNKDDGIFVGSDNSGSFFTYNKAEGNKTYDYEDQSSGSGSNGTANIWHYNIGHKTSPAGLATIR